MWEREIEREAEENTGMPRHRELKSDGAKGDFAEPLWRQKTGHFTT